MEIKKEISLLTEIRDELREMNRRIEWLENTAKEEISKEEKHVDFTKPNWKSYIPLIIMIISLFTLIYFSKQ